MSSTVFVTALAEQLGDQDRAIRDAAAQQLWNYYSPRLLALARGSLAQWMRRRVDEEDILQSMFHSVCLDFKDGKCSVAGRQKLWSLLVCYTMRKISSACEFHTAQRRDPRRERGVPPGDSPSDSSLAGALDDFAARGPTPEEEVVAKLEFERRLKLLPADHRAIVLWRLEGHSIADIAGFLGRSSRTVQLKLQRIRDEWAAES